MYENDTSDVMKWLLRNTWNVLMFYDLWYEDDGDSFDLDERVKWISEQLQMKWERALADIRRLCIDAYDWWELCILFDWDLADFYWEKSEKYINFKDCTLWIINRWNWSWNYQETNIDLTLPFDRKRIWVDDAYSYSVWEIFGMSRIDDENWFLTDDKKYTYIDFEPIEWDSPADKERKRQEYFDDEKKKGICHFGDEKFSRHTTVYVNDYPCWNKCTKCWRFFID
jgi:hypothetical protein